MHTAVIDNLAYQRFALASLRRSLLAKRDMFEHRDGESFETISAVIIKQSEELMKARTRLADLLSGMSAVEYARSLDEERAAPLLSMLVRIGELEEQCGAVNAAIKEHTLAVSLCAAFSGGSREARAVTVQ